MRVEVRTPDIRCGGEVGDNGLAPRTRLRLCDISGPERASQIGEEAYPSDGQRLRGVCEGVFVVVEYVVTVPGVGAYT